jgi:hypothetical protein
VVIGMALRIVKQDGSILQVSSWRAWRSLAPLHMRRRCTACDGYGKQEWYIEGGPNQPDRWFGATCSDCRGKGWRLP